MSQETDYIAYLEETTRLHSDRITELEAALALALYSLESGKRVKGTILALEKLKRKKINHEYEAKFKELNNQINEAEKEI